MRQLPLVQLFYLLVVIVFGAYVRATGSGAGCGSHWPLCNGEFVPTAPALKTLIEYGHRLTSGLTLPLSLALAYWLLRQGARAKIQRNFAFLTVLFVLLEGALGAGLVLWEHVAENTSVYRAFSMGLHLINTFALMAFASLTWASGLGWVQKLKQTPPAAGGSNALNLYSLVGLLTLLLMGLSGAITALGDTVFPVSTSGEALRLSLSDTQHLFIKLRIYHPFLAVAGGALLIFLARQIARLKPALQGLAGSFSALVLAQLLLGYFNVQLLAPVWLQLVHLLFAELLWMGFVVLVYTARSAGALSGAEVAGAAEAAVGRG